MINFSLGKGKKGSPEDPREVADLHELADVLIEAAVIKRFPLDIAADEYKRKKDRGPWIMRAINEATAYDEEHGGWHRRRGSVTVTDWLMFDADKMPYGSYSRVRRALKEQEVPFLMYKSTGHNLECKNEAEAFRVFIQCLPVAAEIAEAVTTHYREDFLADVTNGGEWDPAGDQPTRVMYLPFTDTQIEVFDGDVFDCAAYFKEYELTLVQKGRDGMERGEADARSFGDFVDWCLDEVEDCILIEKPDGRVALQMPGQQPEKYSGGADGGDGWNFYLPSGDYEMLTFKSLHGVTEPEATFKVQDAVNVLARSYGNKPASLYASAVREAMSTADGRADGEKTRRNDIAMAIQAAQDELYKSSRRRIDSDLPDAGAAPDGSEDLQPQTFNNFAPIEWPADLDWDCPEEPDNPGEDASEEKWLKYEEEMQDYNEAIAEWERQDEAIRIERFQFFNESFVLVADGSRIANLNQHPSASPLRLRDWLTQQMPKYYIVGEGDKAKMKQFSDAWLRSSARKEVFDVTYAPGKGRVFNQSGDMMLNRFYVEPFEYTESEDLLDLFFWLVDRTHPIKKEAELFLDWLAFTFRYPQERILWAYVNISEARGSGRGTLKRVIEKLLGVHNVKATDVNMVDKDQYHDYAHECRVTVIEEADEKAGGGRIRISGHWNEAITAQRRMLNLKYGSNGSHTLYNNMVFFLNSASIIIDAEDRRINATTGAPAGIEPISKEKAAEMLRAFNEDEFRDQLASFLWRRDLNDFDHTRSDWDLPARARLLAQSTSVNDEAVDDLITKLPSAVVPAAKVHDMINRLIDGSKILKADAVVKILQSKVVDKKMVCSKSHGSHRCWIFDDASKHPRGWASSELDKCFKSFMQRSTET